MAKREEYLANIRRKLSAFMVEVGMNNRVNRQNINISGEDVCCGLLNLMFDWELKNTNAQDQNSPAIDLADWEEGVAVQVTSDTTSTKIRKTLEKVEKWNLAGKLNKLIVLLLKERPNYTTEFSHDGFELEILDLYDLSKRMEQLSVKKLGQISDYLNEELGSLFDPVPKAVPKHLLPGVPAPSASFVSGSRDRELDDLKEMLASGAPIFLWGVGGIGKTEVAIQLARNFAPPEGAYFLRYYDMPGEGEALRETILRADFTGYSYQQADTENRDHEYKERMDILRTEYAGALLIIDNFDRTGRTLAELQAEPAYQELTSAGIRLVFTTRSQVKKNGYPIEALKEPYLLELMRENLDGVDVSEDEMRQLIEAVEGHTLMVVLMARTLARSHGNLKAADMLSALEHGDLKRRDFLVIANDYNNMNPQARIYDHLMDLFELTDMSEEETDVLRFATLLPEDGMNAGLFMACLESVQAEQVSDEMVAEFRSELLQQFGWLHGSNEEFRSVLCKSLEEVGDKRKNAMNVLIDQGWLSCGRDNLLMIHPVIREVCREELKPTDDNCGNFLRCVARSFNIRTNYSPEQFRQVAKCFSIASRQLEDKNGYWALHASKFWEAIGKYKTAHYYEKQAVDNYSSQETQDDSMLSEIYVQLGSTYCELGDAANALKYLQGALEIYEKKSPPSITRLGLIHNLIGTAYMGMFRYEKALDYFMKAMDIWGKDLRETESDLGALYNNIGTCLSAMGRYKSALEYQKKALEINSNASITDHPDQVRCYCNLGLTYLQIGRYSKALKYLRKAEAISEKVFSPDHVDFANVYNSLAGTYYHLGEHEKAIQYQKRVIELWEKNELGDHPNFAASYNNLAEMYRAQNDYENALKCQIKAIDLLEQSREPNAMVIAGFYNNLSHIYVEIQDYSEAYCVLQKSLEILQSICSPTHPNVLSVRSNLNRLKRKMNPWGTNH